MRTSHSCSFFLAALAAILLATALSTSAEAATTYRFEQAQAGPGETVDIVAVYYNDTDVVADWTPPKQLVLQWRAPTGGGVRSLAYLSGDPVAMRVPVNNFVKVSWRAVVPAHVSGLQAVSIEGTPSLLALDVSGLEHGPVAGTAVSGPIVDVGIPGGAPGTGDPLPPPAIPSASAARDVGPAPNEAGTQGPEQYTTSVWNHFRNALSPYEPVYFAVGTRDGLNARFQISLKYRLFQPPADAVPAFHERLYIGYTQRSLWDLDSPSKPFYDTIYNPSIFWMSDALWQSRDSRWNVGLTAGVDHMSNGRDGEESRSLNAVYAQPALRYRFDGGSTLTFAPKVRTYFGVSYLNRDIADYRGYVDWNLAWARDDGLRLAGQLQWGRSGRNAWQVDLAWPLRGTWLSNLNGYLHVQYFRGYGETLLNYNVRSPSQFRVGLMLVY